MSVPVSIGAAGTPWSWHRSAIASLVSVCVHSPTFSSSNAALREARVVVVERRVTGPVGLAHRAPQPAPVRVVATGDRDPLFLPCAPVETPRRALFAAVASRHDGAGRDALRRKEVGERARDRLHFRDLDVHPGVRATRAADQHRKRADRAETARVVVGVDRRRAHGGRRGRRSSRGAAALRGLGRWARTRASRPTFRASP